MIGAAAAAFVGTTALASTDGGGTCIDCGGGIIELAATAEAAQDAKVGSVEGGGTPPLLLMMGGGGHE